MGGRLVQEEQGTSARYGENLGLDRTAFSITTPQAVWFLAVLSYCPEYATINSFPERIFVQGLHFCGSLTNLKWVLLLYWGSLLFNGKLKVKYLLGIEEGEEVDDGKVTLQSTPDTEFTGLWWWRELAKIPVEKTIIVTSANGWFDDSLVHPLVPCGIWRFGFSQLETEEVKHLYKVTWHLPFDSLKPPPSVSTPTPFPTH